jgi:dTDP-4-amino-4,6-dideoxygalactose transaminase
LLVIEDACQAHGAKYKGRSIGSIGNAAAFSFYPAKNLGAFGDGGMVVSEDGELVEKIKMLRNYGQCTKYYHDLHALNKRLDTIQAAILDVKLTFLDEWNEKRRDAARKYQLRLKDLGILFEAPPEREHVYHLFVIHAQSEDDRDALMTFLKNKNIGFGIHYPLPIHLQKCFSELPYSKGSFPVTEKLSNTVLSLPMFPDITDEEIDYVCDSLLEYYS